MEINTKSIDLDYTTTKYTTTIKSDPCATPFDFQGLTERSNLLQYIQDPNNATCSGNPADELKMYWAEGFWIVKMTAIVYKNGK